MRQSSSGVDSSWIKKADELAALFQFTDALYRANSLADIFDATFDAIERALRCSRASILLFDPAGVMRFVASRGLSESYRRAVDGHSPWRPGDREATPIFVSDIELAEEPQALKDTIRGEGIRALAFIPLTANGVVIGKFMTYREVVHVFTEEEVVLSLTIARQLGFSIERRRTEEAHQRAEEGLRRSNERLRIILDSASEYAIITLDGAGRIASWNSGAERLLGYRDTEILGQPGGIFFSPHDRASDVPEQEMRTAREEGRATNERWHYRKDGSRFWGSGVMLPVEESGQDRYLKIFRDRTEERRADKRQKLLIGELNHRVKNTLATVQSLAEQTLKSADEPEAFAEAFNGRLLALAGAHDLLTREAWQAVYLNDIAQAVLAAWIEDGRVALHGPAIRISPKQALPLSMAFNELLTNAIKYGSLSSPGGRVALSWQCRDVCTVRWEERGGPLASPPQRQGFGLRVLNRGLANELGHPVDLRFEPEGVTCTIGMDFVDGERAGMDQKEE
ncbi:sensor histidine kinase [Ensifer adhaerens]|uniref:sensor histidine kinase n=1 Tax=Ensifer adhaerens TaxID=106592 RepID=UPI0009F205AA|nr:HWE histidine kinase domain-containing protein [Ensifer adhaerens]